MAGASFNLSLLRAPDRVCVSFSQFMMDLSHPWIERIEESGFLLFLPLHPIANLLLLLARSAALQ